MFKDEYRQTFRHPDSCIEENVRSKEEIKHLGSLWSLVATVQRATAHIKIRKAIVPWSTVTTDKLRYYQRSNYFWDNWKRNGDLRKQNAENINRKYKTAFNDNAASPFWKTGDQGGHAVLSLLQNGAQGETFHNHTGDIAVVQSEIMNGFSNDWMKNRD